MASARSVAEAAFPVGADNSGEETRRSVEGLSLPGSRQRLLHSVSCRRVTKIRRPCSSGRSAPRRIAPRSSSTVNAGPPGPSNSGAQTAVSSGISISSSTSRAKSARPSDGSIVATMSWYSGRGLVMQRCFRESLHTSRPVSNFFAIARGRRITASENMLLSFPQTWTKYSYIAAQSEWRTS